MDENDLLDIKVGINGLTLQQLRDFTLCTVIAVIELNNKVEYLCDRFAPEEKAEHYRAFH